MQNTPCLVQFLALCWTGLVLAFVAVLSLPQGERRAISLRIIGCGFGIIAGAYCLTPDDILPQAATDDFIALAVGLAGIVVSIDAGRPGGPQLL